MVYALEIIVNVIKGMLVIIVKKNLHKIFNFVNKITAQIMENACNSLIFLKKIELIFF